MKNKIQSMTNIKYSLLLSIGLLFSNCNNFVEIDQPNSQLTTSTVFHDKKTCEAALMNIYASIRDNGLLTGKNGGLSLMMGVYTDELVFYSNNLPSHREFYLNSVSTQNEVVQTLWNASYNQIYKINAFLEGINKSNALEDDYKSCVTAEALTLRGFLYFYLYQVFGKVPYITSTGYLQNQSVFRDEIDKIRSKIEIDFQDAHSAFVRTTIKNSRTRLSLSALESIMARYYLSINEWNNAWYYSNEVISKSERVMESNLSNEFKKDSNSSLWQFSPNVIIGNSLEAATFMISALPPSLVSLNPDFVNSFENSDQRKIVWIKTLSQGQNVWYQPNKYKVSNPATESVENTIVLRLSEQYLIRGEANFNLSKPSLALNDINMVRNRASLPPLTVLSESRIMTERHHELFTEFGVRFFDLKRLGKLDELMHAKSNWQPYMQNLPIPEKELLLNSNLLPQNEGY